MLELGVWEAVSLGSSLARRWLQNWLLALELAALLLYSAQLATQVDVTVRVTVHMQGAVGDYLVIRDDGCDVRSRAVHFYACPISLFRTGHGQSEGVAHGVLLSFEEAKSSTFRFGAGK